MANDIESIGNDANASALALTKFNSATGQAEKNIKSLNKTASTASNQLTAAASANAKSLNAGTDAAKTSLEKYAADAMDTSASISNAFASVFKGMDDALTKFVVTGKLNFTDLANSMINNMVRIAIQSTITGPLAGKLDGLLKDWFGGGSSAPTLDDVTAATQGVNAGLPLALAKGGAFPTGTGLDFYRNSIVSSPTLFRFAKGGSFGLMGEAGHEAIMPLSRDSGGRLGVKADLSGAGSAPKVEINLINQSGSDMTAQQGGARLDGEQWVVDVVLKRARKDPGFRRQLQEA